MLDEYDEDADGDGIPDDDEIRKFQDIDTEKEESADIDLEAADSGIESEVEDDLDSDEDGLPGFLAKGEETAGDDNDDDVDGDGIPDDDVAKNFQDNVEEAEEDDIEEGFFGTLGGFFKRKLLSLPPDWAGVLLYLSFC